MSANSSVVHSNKVKSAVNMMSQRDSHMVVRERVLHACFAGVAGSPSTLDASQQLSRDKAALQIVTSTAAAGQ
jgi:hypothetical protein